MHQFKGKAKLAGAALCKTFIIMTCCIIHCRRFPFFV